MRRTPLIIATASLVLLAACGSSSPSGGPPPPGGPPTTTQAPVTVDIAGVVTVPVAGNAHVTTKVDYPTNPPAGGPHNAIWQNCGFYSVSVTNENAVHSLEHGSVWITYRPDVDKAQLDVVKARVAKSDHLLASRLDTNPSPFVLTAWGRQLPLDRFDDPRAEQFIRAFVNAPGVAPEPGATCKGGLGVPPDRPNSPG